MRLAEAKLSTQRMFPDAAGYPPSCNYGAAYANWNTIAWPATTATGQFWSRVTMPAMRITFASRQNQPAATISVINGRREVIEQFTFSQLLSIARRPTAKSPRPTFDQHPDYAGRLQSGGRPRRPPRRSVTPAGFRLLRDVRGTG